MNKFGAMEKWNSFRDQVKNSSKNVNTDSVMTMEGAIEAAERTMDDFFNPNLDQDKKIPIDLIHDAKGLAFLTVIKAGFIWTGKVGVGLVISKLPDGRWSAPSAIGTMGMGFGAEMGGQMIDFMIILNTEAAVKSFMQRGQGSIGANLEFAAGPYGRAAGANANFSSTGIAPTYTYSHSKGLFGGVGLQGSAIAARNDLNKKFYGREITPAEILTGAVEQPSAASKLYEAIERAKNEPKMENNYFRNKILNKYGDKIPSPASGEEIQVVYNRVLSTIETMNGSSGVEEFKAQCKDYGQDKINSDQFIAFLRNSFNSAELARILPDVVKLLQESEKRARLWDFYKEVRSAQN